MRLPLPERIVNREYKPRGLEEDPGAERRWVTCVGGRVVWWRRMGAQGMSVGEGSTPLDEFKRDWVAVS